MEIKDTSEIKEGDLSSNEGPFVRFLRDIKEEGEFYTYKELTQILSVSQPTIRKVTHGKGTEAPSKYVTWGKRHVWLFTPDDVEEVALALGIPRSTWQLPSSE